MNSPESSQWSAIRFYQEAEVSEKTHNRLPHWQQEGGTYFVTFRLNDSLPSELLKEWRDERQTWLLQHPKPWSPPQEMEYHRRFSSAIDQHLDASHGSCVLRDSANADLLAQCLQYFDSDHYLLHAWVIMPNHVHILFSNAHGTDLGKTIASWKRFSANQIQKRLGTTGGIWQKDYFDRMIRSKEHFRNVVRYIRNNPVKANLPTGEYLRYEAPWI